PIGALVGEDDPAWRDADGEPITGTRRQPDRGVLPDRVGCRPRGASRERGGPRRRDDRLTVGECDLDRWRQNLLRGTGADRRRQGKLAVAGRRCRGWCRSAGDGGEVGGWRGRGRRGWLRWRGTGSHRPAAGGERDTRA